MQELLEEYRKHAINHYDQTMAGNSVATNKAHDQLLKTLKSLYEANADGEILSLLDDDNASVRSWAATHSLELDEAKSLRILNDLTTAGIPIISMEARHIIQEWQNGELRVRQSL